MTGRDLNEKDVDRILDLMGEISMSYQEAKRRYLKPVQPTQERDLIGLAVRRGLLEPAHLGECEKLRKQLETQGFEAKPLVEILRLKSYLKDDDISELQEQLEGSPPSVADSQEDTFVSAKKAKPHEPEGTSSDEYALAERAIKEGLVSFEQVRDCLAAQKSVRKEGFDSKPVGEILVLKGHLTPEQVELLKGGEPAAPAKPLGRSERLLGDHLVREGVLSPEKRDLGVKLHKLSKGKKFGEVLVEQGLVSQDDLNETILRFGKKVPEPLDEKFEIQFKIGRGATGAVFKAVQKNLDRPVAIKIFYPSLSRQEGFAQRLARDARILGNIKDETIPALVDRGRTKSGLYYIAWAYVDGISLKSLIAERRRLPEKHILRVGIELARIINLGRRSKLSHRALSPANVMLNVEGQVSVTDWITPLSLAVSAKNRRDLGQAYGYVSPECALGRRGDERSDVYSLGAIVYHSATGKPPIESSSVIGIMAAHSRTEPLEAQFLNTELSEEFGALLRRMLAKSPDDRPATLRQCAEEMHRILTAPPKSEAVSAPQAETVPTATLVPFIPRQSTLRHFREPALPAVVKFVWGIAAVLLLCVLASAARRYTTVPRRSKPKGRTEVPVAIEAPREDKFRAKHLARLGEFRSGIRTEHAAVLYHRATKNSEFFKGTAYAGEWLKERESLMQAVNQESLAAWKRIEGELGPLVAALKFGDAQERTRSFPSRIRYFGRGMPTAGERARQAYVTDLVRRSGKPSAITAARVRRAIESGQYELAWVYLNRAKRIMDPEWMAALRSELFEKHYEQVAKFGDEEDLRQFTEVAMLLNKSAPEVQAQIEAQRFERDIARKQ